MLELAITHREALNKAYQVACLDEYYKYYFAGGFHNYEVTLDTNDWNSLQLVSIKGGVLQGYLYATIDRSLYQVTSLGIMKFKEADSIEFTNDLIALFNTLFRIYKFTKISWSVLQGNPIECMYDLVCYKLGGTVLHTFTKDTMLYTREEVNRKLYEVTLTAFQESRE